MKAKYYFKTKRVIFNPRLGIVNKPQLIMQFDEEYKEEKEGRTRTILFTLHSPLTSTLNPYPPMHRHRY